MKNIFKEIDEKRAQFFRKYFKDKKQKKALRSESFSVLLVRLRCLVS